MALGTGYRMIPLGWTVLSYSSLAVPPTRFLKGKVRLSLSTAAHAIVCHTHCVLPTAISFHQQVRHGLLSYVPYSLGRQQLAGRRAEFFPKDDLHQPGAYVADKRAVVVGGSDQR